MRVHIHLHLSLLPLIRTYACIGNRHSASAYVSLSLSPSLSLSLTFRFPHAYIQTEGQRKQLRVADKLQRGSRPSTTTVTT